MGKSKTKYPVGITLNFYHQVMDDEIYEWSVQYDVENSPLVFANIQTKYQQFVKKAIINLPASIKLYNGDQQIVIDEDWKLDVPVIIQQYGTVLNFFVKSRIYQEIQYIHILIEAIQCNIKDIQENLQHLKNIVCKDQVDSYSKIPAPQFTQNQSSITQNFVSAKKLDLGILFSQPLFNEMTKKASNEPVDFRSEIQRLHSSLKRSNKAEINLKCEIATKQNLRNLVRLSSPKILHIICHGTEKGALEFEDDSRAVFGALQIVTTEQIKQTLKDLVDCLPEVVFINSCYSENVGKVFLEMGVNYVISIDSQDKINDEAAQIFSEYFYRNIFNGQKVKDAFNGAKQTVKQKHQSSNQCCCYHSSKEKHKTNCRWIEMIRKSPNSDIEDWQKKAQNHKFFHLPSQLCNCETKHLNRHSRSCKWARQALFNINNDFRVKDGDNFRYPNKLSEYPSYMPKDQLVICCCFNFQSQNKQQSKQFRMPHSESNKFKIFQNSQKIKSQVVFTITSVTKPQYRQIYDHTSHQLAQNNQKIDSTIKGRLKQIYEFVKKIIELAQSIYIVYGPVGVGRTSFILKCVTYLIERRIYDMYFYIDLFQVRDKEVFRYKIYEATKFYDGQIKQPKVKNKSMIIILDNADQFFEDFSDQLYEELKLLRKQLTKTKVILTLRQQNSITFDTQKVHCEKYAIQPLKVQCAASLIFSKMRHMFDTNVQYNDIIGLVYSNPSLRIPKFIESLCQSFDLTSKTKIKVGLIKNKLESILEGDDGTGNKLIQQNLKGLKQKTEDGYNLLLFMSQFSQGLSIQDFKILGLYDKKESLIRLPIGKNWQLTLNLLLENKQKHQLEKASLQTQSNQTEESELSTLSLRNIQSDANFRQNPREKQNQQKQRKPNLRVKSYFLEEVSQNKFKVKRFIREFIWKKHESPQNYYMKYLFVGYLSVMLEFYFKWLIESKYIHQDLIEYSTLSYSGIFGIKDHIFTPPADLTHSVRFVQQQKSEFQKLLTENTSLVNKLKKSDPSVFIDNHKQDFFEIYDEKRWEVVFKHLKDLRNKNSNTKMCQDKACITYLENLTIFIPTAFKIAKVQTSMLKYIITKSMSMLKKLEKYCQEQKYVENHKILCLQQKLNLMKASIDVDKIDAKELKNELQANKQFQTILMKSIKSNEIIQFAKKCWNFQKTYLLMSKEYITQKQALKKALEEKSKLSYEKIKPMTQNLSSWLNEEWDLDEFHYFNKQASFQQIALNILYQKRNLLIGLYYLLILKLNNGAPMKYANTIKLKKQQEKTVLELLRASVNTFFTKGLIKLCLRAKLTIIEIQAFQIIHTKKKPSTKSQNLTHINQNIFKVQYQILIETQKKLIDCEQIYADRKNNLIGLMEFQKQIKDIKSRVKENLWASSSNTIVCMRPVPLIINTVFVDFNGKQKQNSVPIIQNLVRKKNKFRKQIQKVVNPHIDLCTKFSILTKNKFQKQVENGCTMLLLTANVKIQNQKPFLVFQGIRMEEDLVQINQAFLQKYDFSKIKILIIAGNNAFLAIKELQTILVDPPVMIALGNPTPTISTQELLKQTFQSKKPQDLKIFSIEQKRKTQIDFLKEFIKVLMERDIHSKQEIEEICEKCRYIVKNSLELKVLHEKRKSPLEIKQKKGSYKDLSPGYQKNHNIDMDNRPINFVCIRRWIQTYRVFKHIRKRAQQAKAQQREKSPVYINVFGQIASGKSTFIQQIARLFLEREMYSAGIYIIDGKVLEKKYQGEFESYFSKESQVGKIMSLEEFQRNGNQDLMLIIDDFHMVKPRSNGRLGLFLQKIVDKRVNLIFVTNTIYQQENDKKKQSQFMFKKIKPIQIKKFQHLEIDVIASHILNLKDPFLRQKYEELKKKKFPLIRVQDLYDLKSSFNNKKGHNDLSLDNLKDIKKLMSLNQS